MDHKIFAVLCVTDAEQLKTTQRLEMRLHVDTT